MNLQSPLFKARQPAVSRSPRVPCGNRTRLASLEGWHLCRSAKDTTSCGGRNRTCVGAVNSRLPVPARDPPQCQSARLESNQHLRAPEARGLSVSPTRRSKSAQRELNPLFRPGKAAGCRYIMGADRTQPDCQTSNCGQSSGRLRPPLASSFAVEPEGLEPSLHRVRTGDAAANTSIPSQGSGVRNQESVVVWRCQNSDLCSLVSMRPEGFEPSPAWLKARDAAVTPRPRVKSGAAFVACYAVHLLSPVP